MLARADERAADVVVVLELCRGIEILTQAEVAPVPAILVLLLSHTEVVAHDIHVLALEAVAVLAVHLVDVEHVLPGVVITPERPVHRLH